MWFFFPWVTIHECKGCLYVTHTRICLRYVSLQTALKFKNNHKLLYKCSFYKPVVIFANEWTHFPVRSLLLLMSISVRGSCLPWYSFWRASKNSSVRWLSIKLRTCREGGASLGGRTISVNKQQEKLRVSLSEKKESHRSITWNMYT